MHKFLILLILTILLPSACLAQTSTDSVKISVSDLRTANQVFELYDACHDENALLTQQVDDCQQYQDNTHKTIANVQTLLVANEARITDADSVIGLQRQQLTNLQKQMKDKQKIAFRETIGWCVGGFAFGVCVPVLIYFIKH